MAVLAGCLALYAALPGWLTWIAVLTAAGTPLVSVALSTILGEPDALGLFCLPGKERQEQDHRLRPYRCADPLSRVHWKQAAKTGKWLVREEQRILLPGRRRLRPLLPVALCAAVLLLLFPPGEYQRQTQLLQGLLQRGSVQLSLTEAPREKSGKPVLDVVASESQLLYLRGQSYGIYEGESWRTSVREGWSVYRPEGEVRIEARPPGDISFSPYDEAERPTSQYLGLPKATKAWAAPLAEGKTPAQIGEFVRGCASYDEAAVAAGDTARWLVENGRGYCVHFATAAVVLLRSAGIPARLVTGYAVQVQAGVRRTVTGEDAHAWAEYWDGQCWRILEATPTVEASDLSPVQKESRQFGGWWWLLLAALPLFFRKKKNGRLQELRQKAAFSEYGLTEQEKAELERMRKKRM